MWGTRCIDEETHLAEGNSQVNDVIYRETGKDCNANTLDDAEFPLDDDHDGQDRCYNTSDAQERPQCQQDVSSRCDQGDKHDGKRDQNT